MLPTSIPCLCYVAIATLVVAVAFGSYEDMYPECIVTHRQPRLYSWFYQNGAPLPTHGRIVYVHQKNQTECYVNTTGIVDRFNSHVNSGQYQVGLLMMACEIPIRVHMSPTNASINDNVIFYVQLSGCTMGHQDWEYITRIAANTRVFTMQGTLDENDTLSTLSQCSGFNNLVAFTFENLLQSAPNLIDALNCSKSYPEMAEVIFSNISWSELPTGFHGLFPNLQALEIQHNKLTVPPSRFPWANDTMKLPLNLSRSSHMQNHYSEAEGLVIPSNIFRRFLNMNYNRVTSLEDYIFHGYLDMITLKGNNMTAIGNTTFQNITGLQHLDLSQNNLDHLPDGLFKGLHSLRVLHINNNRLMKLKHSTFNDLISLINIDLANNSIVYIEHGTFTNMRRIEVIHLEFNNLTYLSPDAFPLDSITLRELYLHHNPLVTIPEFVFWIRSLTLADLHSSDITLNNFTEYLANLDSIRLTDSIVDSASDSDVRDILKRADKLRKIDLHSCRITSVYIDFSSLTRLNNATFLVLLLHFELNFKDNPINCNCQIIPISTFINEYVKNSTISDKEYFFNNWVCRTPVELAGRALLKVAPEETYCGSEAGIVVDGCPVECQCYRRSVSNNAIIDCRRTNLDHVHSMLPTGHLELWYNGNNISTMNSIPELNNVVVLDLSHNRLQYLGDNVFSNMQELKQLHLESNLLTYLPTSLQSLDLSNVTIHPNPLQCDCKSLWLKQWITKHKQIVQDWNKISCVVGNEEGRALVEVSDDRFVCIEEFDGREHVPISSVVCSVIVLLLLIMMMLVYAYRLEFKVFLFINFGVHPFDNDTDDTYETIDCVIAHSGDQTDWVMEQIVEILESENYNFVVCDMARDFVVGFTFHDNLSRVVSRSKRMVFCVTEDWNTQSESFAMAWSIAQKKISEIKSNFGIIVTHGIGKDQITDKEMLRFMKRRRYVDSSDRLFLDKIVYYMPRKREAAETEMVVVPRTNNEMVNCMFEPCKTGTSLDDIAIDIRHLKTDKQNQNGETSPIFISYSDNDLQYVLKDLQPKLEQHGYNLCIPDRDFIVGASKEENILQAIDTSIRTLFVLSGSHLQDEWSLFTFRTAYEKSLRESSNHLIVIAREHVDMKHIDEEVRNYLRNYIYLHVNDRWFDTRLFNSLPQKVEA